MGAFIWGLIGFSILAFGIASCFTGVGILWGIFCIFIGARMLEMAMDGE